MGKKLYVEICANLDDAMERMNYTFNGQSTMLYQGNLSTIQAVQNVAKAYVYGAQMGVELFYKGFGVMYNQLKQAAV